MSVDGPRRFLIIRLSSIGDVVLTTPLVRLLRKQYPEAQIDYLTKARFAELLRGNPGVTRVLEFPDYGGWREIRAMRRHLKRQRYQAIFDLHKNIRSLAMTCFLRHGRISRLKKYGFRRLLLVRARLNFYDHVQPVYRRYIDVAGRFGIEDDGGGSELFIPEQVRERVDRHLQAAGLHLDALVSLAPGAGFATKRWPAAYFAEVAVHLLASGFTCCVLGGAQDREFASAILELAPGCFDFTGQLSLLESAAVLQQSRFVVTNDSGLMHMAEAVQTPVVAIFGSTVRELGFFPMRPDSQVVENNNIDCRPCSHIGRKACPKGHFLCMQAIKPERVVQVLPVHQP